MAALSIPSGRTTSPCVSKCLGSFRRLIPTPSVRSTERLFSLCDHSCSSRSLKGAVKPYAMTQTTAEHLCDDERTLFENKAMELRDLLAGTSIFLVGTMGSGKTTVGKILAEVLGYCFFDSDRVVEEAAGGASVAQIFEENGEESFRDAESMVIRMLSASVRLVVATGGGTVLRKENWGYMRDGIVVWLNAPLEAIADRVTGSSGSKSDPVLFNGEQINASDALEKLSLVFNDRQVLYKSADAEVSLLAIAGERGVDDLKSISPMRVAYQVLLEVETLIRRKTMGDDAKRLGKWM